MLWERSTYESVASARSQAPPRFFSHTVHKTGLCNYSIRWEGACSTWVQAEMALFQLTVNPVMKLVVSPLKTAGKCSISIIIVVYRHQT